MFSDSVYVAGEEFSPPDTALTATPSSVVGSITAGNYLYVCTYTTLYGETLPGVTSATVAANSSISLTNIPQRAGVRATSVYRSSFGEAEPYRLITTTNKTTFVDTLSDASRGALLPLSNSANTRGRFVGEWFFTKPTVRSTLLVIATGSTRSNAAQITAEYSFVSTASGDGVVMPYLVGYKIGTTLTISNTGPNALNVYPFELSTSMAGEPAGAPYVLGAGSSVNLIAMADEWRSLSSTGSGISNGTPAGGSLSGTYPNPTLGQFPGVAGSYTVPDITVNNEGRITAASNGSAVTSITAGDGLTGGVITSAGTIGLGTELLGLSEITTNGICIRTAPGTYITELALSAPRGGTGLATYAVGDILYSGASNSLSALPKPSAVSVLQMDGAGLPSWVLRDDISSGIDPKEQCEVASIADVAGTYATTPSNGQFTNVDMTNATLFSLGAYVVAAGDRVLVKDQTDPLQNGIYTVSGTLATATLTRSFDQDGLPLNEVSAGNFTFIQNGGELKATGWVVSGSGTLTLNTDPVNWYQFSSTASLNAGDGLNIVGTTISLDVPVITTHGGTGIVTYAVGDILYSGASNSLSALPKPSVVSILQMDGAGLPSWIVQDAGTVLDDVPAGTAGAERYPVDLSSGIWYGSGTKANGVATSIRIGNGAIASALDSISIGSTSNASGITSIAIGQFSEADGQSVAVGRSSKSLLTGSSFGDNSEATGGSSVAIGVNTLSSAVGTIAIGFGAEAARDGTVSIGVGALCNGVGAIDAIAIGHLALASGLNAVAVGVNTAASAAGSCAFGDRAIASGIDAVAIGTDALVSGGSGSVAVGPASSAGFGGLNTCIGKEAGASLSTGFANTFLGYRANFAAGSDPSFAISIGYTALSSADNTISIGRNSAAVSSDSICLGRSAFTNGVGSIAIGSEVFTRNDAAVCIGHLSGSTGFNVVIGSQSKAGGGTNNIYVGHNCGNNAETVDNSITYGNSNVCLGSGVFNSINGTNENTGIGHEVLTNAVSDTVNAGTVSSAGTTVTGVGTAFTTDMVGGMLVVNLSSYRIVAVASATSLTTSSAATYNGQAYVLYYNSYANTGVGYQALSTLTNGKLNTTLGFKSGNTITTGNSNTLLGYEADVDAGARSGAVALGDGIIATVDNGFFVKHRSAVTPASAQVSVYDTASNESVGLVDATVAGQVLTSNAAGGLSWATPAGGGVTVQEEGVSLATSGTILNFVGSAVTASGTGATKTITISSPVGPTVGSIGLALGYNNTFGGAVNTTTGQVINIQWDSNYAGGAFSVANQPMFTQVPGIPERYEALVSGVFKYEGLIRSGGGTTDTYSLGLTEHIPPSTLGDRSRQINVSDSDFIVDTRVIPVVAGEIYSLIASWNVGGSTRTINNLGANSWTMIYLGPL